jgi:hypothetical protein
MVLHKLLLLLMAQPPLMSLENGLTLAFQPTSVITPLILTLWACRSMLDTEQ